MADQSKLLFVNANGRYEESSVADSLKYASFKTDNYELTDTLLGKLVSAITTSAGVADADKFVKTASTGKFDMSLIPDAVFNERDWKESVRAASNASQDVDISSAPASIGGVTLASGNRVLLWQQTAGEENGIYVFNGAASAMTRALDADTALEMNAGMSVAVTEGTQADTYFLLTTNDPIVIDTTSLIFTQLNTGNFFGGKGILLSGNTFSADLLTGGGLKFVGSNNDDDELAVEPSDFAGEGLVDDGSDNLAIDWSTAFNDSKAIKASDLSSNTNGLGASIIGIEDAAGYYTGTDVEAALAEAYEKAVSQAWNIYVADGAVAKGDLVYISANDEVATFATVTANQFGIGLAFAAAGDTTDVKVLKNDEIISGLTFGGSPVAGARVYWNGSAHTTVIPSGVGAYVYQTGFIKDAAAGELHVNVQFIKRNS
jgi:hypothetical protein